MKCFFGFGAKVLAPKALIAIKSILYYSVVQQFLFFLDFQRIVNDMKDFLTKLHVNDTSAELRDALNFSLLHLHKYYKRLRHQIKVCELLTGSLLLLVDKPLNLYIHVAHNINNL